MTDIAGVQNEFGGSWQSIDLVNRSFERGDDIGICGLIESHMAVTDLGETQFTNAVQFLRMFVRAESVRLQHASFNQAQSTGARPGHAPQESAAIDAVTVVIVLD